MNFRNYVLEAFQAIDDSATADIFDRPFTLHMTPHASCPYSFEAKTIGDVVDFLGQSRRYGSAPMSWNVKAYNVDVNGGDNCDYTRQPSLDKAWEKYLGTRAAEYVHAQAFEAAQEYYREDWNAYPGDDQGDWLFSFEGRQGGHLTLQRWRGNDLRDMCRSEFAEFVASLIDEPVNLSKFYVGIVCADQEFTPTKASENVSYNYGAERSRWEESRAEIVIELASAMYGAAKRKADEYGVEVTAELLRQAAAKVA